MKVLLVNSLTPQYGSTLRARNIYRAIKELKHRVIYLESNSDIKADDVISIVQWPNLAGYFLASLSRAYYCLAAAYDICVIQKITPLTFLAILAVKIRGRKLILDWDDLDSEFQATPFRKYLSCLIERGMPRFADYITTHNIYLKDYALSVGAREVFIVPQVVDTETFDPGKFNAALLQREKKLEDKTVLAYLCTFTEGGTRDIGLVFEAVSKAMGAGHKIHLLLIGGGSLERKIKNRLKEFKITQYTITGFLTQEEVAERLTSAVICLVYMKDDMGNRMRMSLKTLEYLAMEKKIIGYLSGETKDRLGMYCTLIEPNVESFSRAIIQAIREKDFSNRGAREYILKNYSLESMKKSLIGLIK
jgi:glycosyltransferase involved in cell wall biosynthesis